MTTTDTKSFAHPAIFSKLAAFGAFFSVVTCVVIAALPLVVDGPYGTGDWILIGLGVVSALACLYASVAMLRRARDTVEVSADGLRCHSPNHPTVDIPWSEVARVEAQNVMQRLVVTDAAGARTIHLEYHLENFGELRRIVFDRSAGTTAPPY